MSYRVKTVAKMTGLNRSTLLAWERRYGVVSPLRGDNGYRSYTAQDVDRLQRLKSLVDSGHAISEAVQLLGGDLDRTRGLLMERLLAFDHEGARELAERVQGEGVAELTTLLYLPLLRELGVAWERGETSVAQEHFASAFVSTRMHGLMARARRASGERPLAAMLTPSGEKHELGLMSVGIQVALEGWAVDWLGLELPVTELPAYCAQKQPDVVCVSVVRDRPAAALRRLVESFREAVPAGTRVVFGGHAVARTASTVAGVEHVNDVGQLIQLLESIRRRA